MTARRWLPALLAFITILLLPILALTPARAADTINGSTEAVSLNTSYHTIAIDGTNDFAADEVFATTSGGYTAYATWDADNLYLGYSGSDVGNGDRWINWYIDSDPSSPPDSGNGTTDAVGFNTQDWRLPFNADYQLQFRTDGQYPGLKSWNGSVWSSASYTGRNYVASNFVEVRIPRSEIGNPSEINILGYFINETGRGEWTYASWPAGSINDGYHSQNNNPLDRFTKWYHFTLVAGVAPNQGPVLAVTMEEFTATGHPAGVTLHWTTVSELEALGFHLYRAESETGTQQRLTDGLIPAMGGPAGGSYEYNDGTALAGTTYYYWLEALNTDGSSQRFGPVSATPMIPTAIILTESAATTPPAWPFILLAGISLAGAMTIARRRS